MDFELKTEDGSAAHQSRNNYPHGPSRIPRPRLNSTTSPGPSAVGQTPAQARHQPSADDALLTDDGGKLQKIKRPLRLRPITRSTNSRVESGCVRTTKSRPLPIGVAGHERAPLTTSNRAGASRKKPKSNLSEPTATTAHGSKRGANENENIPQTPHKAGDSKVITNTISAPLHESASSILNVDPFDVATEHATHPSPYLSISTLDVLSSWDMDSLPTIPSPPGSPVSQTTTTAPAPSIFSNPFSDTTDDDDASLENEIPFPLNRHSKVVREDMGIKKSKNKGSRNYSASILNRHVVSPTIESPPTSPPASGLPCLPHPHPLRTLCQNTTSQPSTATSSPASTKARLSPPKTNPPSGPSSSRKDKYGFLHLGASDCELSIAFPQTSHFEVWDIGDDSHIAVPALLCLMAKDTYAWSGTPLALPDVTFIDIRCSDVPLPSRMSVYDSTQGYTTRYVGPQPQGGTTSPSAASALLDARVTERDEITLERNWMRTYSQPGVAGSSRILRFSDMTEAFMRAAAPGPQPKSRGFVLQFWIPIPARLFFKRETRVFNISARVLMMGDEERMLSLDENNGQVRPLTADTQMTVSHLRTPREMDGVWWC